MSFIKGEFELVNTKSNFGGRLMRAKILGKNDQIISKQILKIIKDSVFSSQPPVVKSLKNK